VNSQLVAKPVAVEGEPPTNVTVIESKNIDEGKKFFLSPEMKQLREERTPFVTARGYLVEGRAN
jgi:uncharacterized protein (DUF1330 family)